MPAAQRVRRRKKNRPEPTASGGRFLCALWGRQPGQKGAQQCAWQHPANHQQGGQEEKARGLEIVKVRKHRGDPGGRRQVPAQQHHGAQAENQHCRPGSDPPSPPGTPEKRDAHDQNGEETHQKHGKQSIAGEQTPWKGLQRGSRQGSREPPGCNGCQSRQKRQGQLLFDPGLPHVSISFPRRAFFPSYQTRPRPVKAA